ncbi:rRNA biogenesis protein rrp36 [Ascosphaera atra]|nr:rRNA biogenesis protein rrp36 [Ascosphaera atra]
MGNSKRSRRTSSQNAEDSKSPLDDIRNRIRATRDEKEKGEDAHRPSKEELRAKLKRSSKHAPQAMSTKHQVTRKRIVVEPSNAPKARDPRFDSVVLNNSLPRTVGAAGNAEHLARQRYGFLKDYRASELSELRKMMGQTKNPEEKERIKRAVTSMSDRQRAYERKERERKIRSEHKKRERELIREGKKSKAFHLKDSEVKKQAQLERYKEMSGRQRQKALEHKRKKMASKEAREMPWTRRGAEE